METVFETENVRLIQGDCREVIPTLSGVDCVITDPPYGIRMDTKIHESCGRVQYDSMIGDEETLDLRFLWESFPLCVVFGANNFTEQLPRGGGWIVWDKRSPSGVADEMFGWPFELAWTSVPKLGRMIRVQHGGYLNADKANARREHPTQKPVRLMAKCMEAVRVPIRATVLDPFCGSASTLIAALETGRKSIGIEISEEYCAVAKRRLERWHAQERLNL